MPKIRAYTTQVSQCNNRQLELPCTICSACPNTPKHKYKQHPKPLRNCARNSVHPQACGQSASQGCVACSKPCGQVPGRPSNTTQPLKCCPGLGSGLVVLISVVPTSGPVIAQRLRASKNGQRDPDPWPHAYTIVWPGCGYDFKLFRTCDQAPGPRPAT